MLQMPEATGDYIKDLENLVEFHKLEKPTYEIKEFKTKQNNFVSCILRVKNLHNKILQFAYIL